MEFVARDEQHVWYELDVAVERPHHPLADGLELRSVGAAAAADLQGLTSLSPATSSARLGEGADLWVVYDAVVPAFACWIFRRSTPVFAAPNGRLLLPERTVCLEDSVTAATHRGRGIAPAAWGLVADAVRDAGDRWIVTKVAVENTSSRRAVEKSGFAETATMSMRLRGRRKDVRVEGESTFARHLTRELDPTSARP